MLDATGPPPVKCDRFSVRRISPASSEGRACAWISAISAVVGVGTFAIRWAFLVEAGSLDSAANRGVPFDSRDEDIS